MGTRKMFYRHSKIRPADNNNFVIMRYHAMIEIVIFFFSSAQSSSVDKDRVGIYALCVAEPRGHKHLLYWASPFSVEKKIKKYYTVIICV